MNKKAKTRYINQPQKGISSLVSHGRRRKRYNLRRRAYTSPNAYIAIFYTIYKQRINAVFIA